LHRTEDYGRSLSMIQAILFSVKLKESPAKGGKLFAFY